MSVVLRFTAVVVFVDNENDDVSILSRSWLKPAFVPKFDGTRFRRLMRTHADIPERIHLQPVRNLLHTNLS